MLPHQIELNAGQLLAASPDVCLIKQQPGLFAEVVVVTDDGIPILVQHTKVAATEHEKGIAIDSPTEKPRLELRWPRDLERD